MMIAVRTISLQTKDRSVEIPIRIFAPEEGRSGSWICRYEIDWPEGRWTMEASGIDSVQALVMALFMIGSEIYTSGYHKAGQLKFESPGSGYGFPVPVTLRDLLKGGDKAFF